MLVSIVTGAFDVHYPLINTTEPTKTEMVNMQIMLREMMEKVKL